MFYPGRPDASHTYVGEQEGEGYNVNVPWNGASMGAGMIDSASPPPPFTRVATTLLPSPTQCVLVQLHC